MKYFAGLLLIVSLSSCEGYFRMEGRVIGSHTGIPVKDASFTLMINEHDTMALRCNIIERDSISAKKRIQLRNNNISDPFTRRGDTSFYKYCDTLIHPDGSFNLGSKLINFTAGAPAAKLVVSSPKHHSEVVMLNGATAKDLTVRLVER